MLKILVVEDDYMTREGIVKIMPWEDMGISEVKQADDGVNALQIVQQFKPHIILSDIRMPRMDGIEFAAKIRQIVPECKIIFISAYPEREYYKSAISLKAVAFVEKPINIDELKIAIENAVSQCFEEIAEQNHTKEVNGLLQESIPFIRNEIALLLTTRDNDFVSLRQKIKLASIDIPKDSCFVSIILRFTCINNPPENLLKSIRKEIVDILEHLIHQNSLNAFYAFIDDENAIIHIYDTQNSKYSSDTSDLKKLFEIIYLELKDKIEISFAIGEKVNRIEDLYKSYNTAIIALQRMFFNTGFAFSKYIKDQSPSFPFDNGLLDIFSDMVLKGKQIQLIKMINNLTSDLMLHQNTKVDLIINFYYKMLYLLYKDAETQKINLDTSIADSSYLWNIITEISSLLKLEAFLIDKINAYFLLLSDRSINQSIISNVQKYCHANYQIQNLTIHDISKYVALTPAYLCVLFKKETGKTLMQYVTECRMEKSKELLRNKMLKIADIANDVGYNEGDYFAKVFRKTVGVSPSEYREHI